MGTTTLPPNVFALSIRQPWAWLIVRGHKDIENRVWSTNLRGRILIHAGKGYGREGEEDREFVMGEFGIAIPSKADLEFGGIVGHADLVDCVHESRSRWFNGPFGLVFANAAPRPFEPRIGALNFFRPGSDATSKPSWGRR